MTDDIVREKAEALIKYIEDVNSRGADSTAGWDKRCEPYKALKAALRPSREEIADYLDKFVDGDDDEYTKWLSYAIAELRQPITNQESKS